MSTSHPFSAPQAPAARKHGCVRQVAPNKFKVTVELPADETGKRRQRSKTIRGTQKEAENLLQTMLDAVGKPEVARPVEAPAGTLTPLTRENEVNLTLNQFFRQFYLPEVRRDLRADTVAGYKSDYERLI